jgi:very-short-patch-repair endonuclease
LGVLFYRQKPIGRYIVDFYAPGAKLVIEVDGGQHLDGTQAQNDVIRDRDLASLGLKVLRFNSREVMKERDAVLEIIRRSVVERINAEIPPAPLFQRGE